MYMYLRPYKWDLSVTNSQNTSYAVNVQRTLCNISIAVKPRKYLHQTYKEIIHVHNKVKFGLIQVLT